MEVVGVIIFFGGLIALLVIVTKGGLSSPRKPAVPDLTFGLGSDELRIYVFEDGWSEVEKISAGKIANVWETYAWDEAEVKEILAEAGADLPSWRLGRRRSSESATGRSPASGVMDTSTPKEPGTFFNIIWSVVGLELLIVSVLFAIGAFDFGGKEIALSIVGLTLLPAIFSLRGTDWAAEKPIVWLGFTGMVAQLIAGPFLGVAFRGR